MDYIVHGILQARILEWETFPFSKGSSQPKDWTQVSLIVGGFFTFWATRDFEMIQIQCFFSEFHSRILASIGDLVYDNHVWWVSISFFPSTFTNYSSSVRTNCSFSPFYLHTWLFLSTWTLLISQWPYKYHRLGGLNYRKTIELWFWR